MRKGLGRVITFIVCTTLVVILCGCNNKTSVDEKINKFKQFIIQEDYGFATKIYIDNYNDNDFFEEAISIAEETGKEIIDNMNSDNISNAKAFADFLSSIDYSSMQKNVLKKIDEIEEENKKGIIDNDDTTNKVDTITSEGSESVTNNEYTPKLEITNDYGDFNYKTYYNSRFGYSIEYPSFLVNEMGSQNNSGVVLSNENNTVKLTLWADNNALFLTLQEVYDNALAESVNVTYSNLGSKSYVVSGEEGEYVYYKNQVVGEGSMNGFMIRYPKKDEEFFDDIVTKLYNTFNAPNVEECW